MWKVKKNKFTKAILILLVAVVLSYSCYFVYASLFFDRKVRFPPDNYVFECQPLDKECFDKLNKSKGE